MFWHGMYCRVGVKCTLASRQCDVSAVACAERARLACGTSHLVRVATGLWGGPLYPLPPPPGCLAFGPLAIANRSPWLQVPGTDPAPYTRIYCCLLGLKMSTRRYNGGGGGGGGGCGVSTGLVGGWGGCRAREHELPCALRVPCAHRTPYGGKQTARGARRQRRSARAARATEGRSSDRWRGRCSVCPGAPSARGARQERGQAWRRGTRGGGGEQPSAPCAVRQPGDER